jgi:peptide/nickel transport system substrate-binding protein
MGCRSHGVVRHRHTAGHRARSAALLVVAMVLACGALGVAAAFGDDTASPSADGAKTVLRVGWTTDPDSLNPFIGIETSSYEIFGLNYDFLTSWDAATLETRPGLAESWTSSEDGKVWTFKLREDVKWHDGEAFTAADVAFTYDYIMDNEMGMFLSFTTSIDSVTAVDDYTVEFACSQPKANMLSLVIPILPEHVWSKIDPGDAEDSFENPAPIVGTGPFQVVERKNSDFVRLQANEDYFGGTPQVDEVIFQTYQNADTMAQDLLSGQLDAATELLPATFPNVEKDERFDVSTSDPFRLVHDLGFNCTDPKVYPKTKGNPVLLDPAFRRALNYAIDKDKICEIAYSGYAVPAETVIVSDYYTDPDWHWTPPDDVRYTFDLDKANAELDAAGYTDDDGDGIREYKGKPISLRFWVLKRSPERQSAGKFMTGWFTDIGLDIKYEVLDEGVLIDRMWNYEGDEFAPDFDMFLWGWSGDIDPDFLLAAFTTGQIENWSDCNWSSAEYDDLYLQQQRAIDPIERQAIIHDMQELVYRESPEIFFAQPGVLTAWNTDEWEGWVRSPADIGPAIGCQYVLQSYIDVHPAGAQADEEGSSTLWIAALVIAVIAAAIVIVVLVRRGRRPETVG